MRYFIGKNGRQLGPFDGQQVRAQLDSGAVAYDDLFWREGMPGWAPIRTEFPPISAPPLPPPGLAAPAPAPAQTPPPPATAPATGTGTFSGASASAGAGSLTGDFAPDAPATAVPGANTGLVLGCVNLVAWFIPLFGLPLSIWGLIASVKARGRGAGGKAIAGIVLNSITLLLSVLNAAVGAYLGATGQHPLVK